MLTNRPDETGVSEVQGNQRVVDFLNDLLTMELTAINQYFCHTRMVHNWGYHRLAKHIRDQAFDEMRDAEEIIDRILFFDGLPNLQRLGTVSIGEAVTEQLELMLQTELNVCEKLTEGIALCLEENDQATREFLAEALPEEEKHVDWIETQLAIIRQIGEANYLAQQLHD